MAVPAYVAYAVLGGNLAIIGALLFGLRQALARAGWAAEKRAPVLRTACVVLIGWYGAVLALSWFGFFAGAPGRIPTIGFGVFPPIVVGAIALWRSGTLSRIIDAVPQSWLVGVQLYRVLGATFLILLGIGRLPGVFALPAGVDDVLVGILAPVVGLAYASGVAGRGRLVLAWNVFGLLDLVAALGTGFLTSPSPFQLLSLAAPNTLVSAFPLVLIPVFAVPLSVLLHVASLMKLRREAVQETQPHVRGQSLPHSQVNDDSGGAMSSSDRRSARMPSAAATSAATIISAAPSS